MTNQPPILDFDAAQSAIINPSSWHQPIDDIPKQAVITWMADAHDQFIKQTKAEEIYRLEVESFTTPIYKVEFASSSLVLAVAQVGAPPSALLLETLIAVGCTTFIAVGSSGGLTDQHPPGSVIVPSTTIRDEGTSYHYLPADASARPDPATQARLLRQLQRDGFDTTPGTVWTTDAIYRETQTIVQQRVEQGAIAVDMESSALAAVATHRGVTFGHAVYIADTLHNNVWDPEALTNPDAAYRLRLLTSACSAHNQP